MTHTNIDGASTELDLHGTVIQIEKGKTGVAVQTDRGCS